MSPNREGKKPGGGIYVPPRYHVRLNADFKLGQPVQVEVDLLPTGIFGVQDGRTPRKAEAGTSMVFDQKTGAMVLHGPGGEPISLEPVFLTELSLGVNRHVSMAGNRITWIEPDASSADREKAAEGIQRSVHMLVAVLPMIGYRRRAPISISTLFLKQDGHLVGWAELLALNLVIRPYDREFIESQLRTLEPWQRTIFLDTARWWAMVYYCRAMRHIETPFLDDVYAEIIVNLWKAAEAMLRTWKIKEIVPAAKRLGLSDAVAAELAWLCKLRHSDDVAHAVIYRKEGAEEFAKLYDDRDDKVRRADNVIRDTIDHGLESPREH
jgi:hypothetical protein